MTRRIKGLYAVTPDWTDTQLLLSRVEAVLRGGVALLQYRNKSASAELRYEQARALLPLCRRYDIPLIVNDHVALAHEIGADGVHLGGGDGDIAAARSLLGSGPLQPPVKCEVEEVLICHWSELKVLLSHLMASEPVRIRT